jgi:hypothetical protein
VLIAEDDAENGGAANHREGARPRWVFTGQADGSVRRWDLWDHGDIDQIQKAIKGKTLPEIKKFVDASRQHDQPRVRAGQMSADGAVVVAEVEGEASNEVVQQRVGSAIRPTYRRKFGELRPQRGAWHLHATWNPRRLHEASADQV